MSGMSPPDHRTSNYLQARKKLFHTGLVPDGNIFRFLAEIPDAEEVAADYEKTLQQYFLPKDQLNGFPRFET